MYYIHAFSKCERQSGPLQILSDGSTMMLLPREKEKATLFDTIEKAEQAAKETIYGILSSYRIVKK